MSEDVKGLMGAQEEMMRRLKAIGADLWGGSKAGTKDEHGKEDLMSNADIMTSNIEEAWQQEMKKNNMPRRATPASSEKDRETVSRPKIGIENLWMTTDETIDWTEALLHETPNDGLTGQKKWSFFHRMAKRVLEGDIDAYAEVLTTVNPLGDLSEYVSGMILRTPGPDRVECVFECQRDHLEQYGKKYLGALSLRAARDLLAVLPVTEVGVTGNLDGTEKIRVTFRRDQLLKKKMAFLDPVQLAEDCGGVIRI